MNLGDIDPGLLYCMFKGEPGTRKSTAALSFPRPQYWFSWDRKMESLLLPMKNFGINPREVEYDDYDDWTKARVKLEQFQIRCPYKTIVLDSITSAADSALRQTMLMKKGTNRSSGAAAGKTVAGIAVNELEDYNAEAAALQEMISLTKDIHKVLKVNVVLIAHVIQAEYKTVGGASHMSRTIVTAGKKIAAKIPAYCTEVYHFNIEAGAVIGQGGNYAVLTQHTGDDFARTSLPLENKILFGNDPLYDRYLLPAIQKQQQSQKDNQQPKPTVSAVIKE
jgi:hypothetical protein